MESLPSEVKMEILSLQFLKGEDLFKRYPTLLADMKGCRQARILRCVVAYRLQEQTYGKHLKESTLRYLNTIAGDPMSLMMGEKSLSNGTQLMRKWKGENYVVRVRKDGSVVYNNAVYSSLTAVARLITGTRCNGREFFGVEPRIRKGKEDNGKSVEMCDLHAQEQ